MVPKLFRIPFVGNILNVINLKMCSCITQYYANALNLYFLSIFCRENVLKCVSLFCWKRTFGTLPPILLLFPDIYGSVQPSSETILLFVSSLYFYEVHFVVNRFFFLHKASDYVPPIID